jgi:UDP-N-acetylglucosamine 2-epimerase
VLCHPNADESNRAIQAATRSFVAGDPARRALVVNLPPAEYWSLLHHADAMAGNSSSLIMESPSLRLPAVCAGRRQQGRERAANVIDAPANAEAVAAALARALDPAFRASFGGLENPYGDGRSAERIVEILATLPPAPVLLEKRGIPDSALAEEGRVAFGSAAAMDLMDMIDSME